MSKARSTVSIARTTPAQKLRGAHRSTRSLGFGASGGTAASTVIGGTGIGADPPDMGRGPDSVKHDQARPGGACRIGQEDGACLYLRYIPVIPDDMAPPAGGRSTREILPREIAPWSMRC